MLFTATIHVLNVLTDQVLSLPIYVTKYSLPSAIMFIILSCYLLNEAISVDPYQMLSNSFLPPPPALGLLSK